jgi:hypothetical protein
LERMAVRRDESGQRMPVGHPREATIAPPCRDVQRSCGIPANRYVAAQVAKSRGRGVPVVSRTSRATNRRQGVVLYPVQTAPPNDQQSFGLQVTVSNTVTVSGGTVTVTS